MQPKLSVIVPIYKQEKTIERDLRRIKGVLSKLRYSSELIGVIDGFVDDSFKNASKVPGVKVVGYSINKGKGHAVRFGMAKSRGDIVAFIDSGMEIDPNGISMILEHMEWYNADIIIGSKRHPASQINYPLERRIISRIYQLFVRLFVGLNVTDTQLGLKVYKRAVLENILPRLIVKRYAFDLEMLAVAYSLGYRRIFEAPIKVNYNFGDLTHASTLKSMWRAFVDTLAVIYRLRILHYYSSSNKRKWLYDPELNFRINTI